jgi:hypothetical protein
MALTPEIKKAIKHVKKFHPTLRFVIFTVNGWLYMDEEYNAFKFNKKINVSCLEEAYDSLETIPAIFDVEM